MYLEIVTEITVYQIQANSSSRNRFRDLYVNNQKLRCAHNDSRITKAFPCVAHKYLLKALEYVT